MNMLVSNSPLGGINFACMGGARPTDGQSQMPKLPDAMLCKMLVRVIGQALAASEPGLQGGPQAGAQGSLPSALQMAFGQPMSRPPAAGTPTAGMPMGGPGAAAGAVAAGALQMAAGASQIAAALSGMIPGQAPSAGAAMAQPPASPFGMPSQAGLSPFAMPPQPMQAPAASKPSAPNQPNQQNAAAQAAPANGQGTPPTPSGPKSGVPGAPDAAPKRSDKPADPSKSVDDYLDANHGVLRHLGNQEGMKDKLKQRYGDWDNANLSDAERKQAAYNASRHVGMCKNKNDYEGGDRGKVETNGKLEGCTKGGQIRAGTEMAALKDSLKGTGEEQDKNASAILGNPNLAKTNDGHVRKDGTVMSNAQYVGHKILGGLKKAAGWIGGVLDKLPGPLKFIGGPINMLSKAVSGGLGVADAAVSGGNVKQAAKEWGHGLLKTGSGIVSSMGQVLGSTLGRLPGPFKIFKFAEVGTTAIAGSLDVADTALQGGDVKGAAVKMGKDVAQSAVESTVGLVDPTNVVASTAGKAFRGAIDSKA
ncbi:MAG TPA: HrpF/NolX family T3SS translocon protein [Albitalea sp.]|uniref:HrpF/NolX family T3SS translocon protein n=1 Tax=Piscinibacter sp. TaxID=1903157 RepID=UPI002ED1EEE7